MGVFSQIFDLIFSQLQRPGRVLVACVLFLFLSFSFHDTWRSLYVLAKEQNKMREQNKSLSEKHQKVDLLFKRAHDPSYIAAQAIDHYEMVGENDILFIFPDSEK